MQMADIIMAKIVWNSVFITPNGKYACVDINETPWIDMDIFALFFIHFWNMHHLVFLMIAAETLHLERWKAIYAFCRLDFGIKTPWTMPCTT